MTPVEEVPMSRAALPLPRILRTFFAFSALALAPAPEVVDVLLAIHGQVWQETIDHMGEFIRKRDYRFSHEPLSEQEATSVLRAIAILTGEYPLPG